MPLKSSFIFLMSEGAIKELPECFGCVGIEYLTLKYPFKGQEHNGAITFVWFFFFSYLVNNKS